MCRVYYFRNISIYTDRRTAGRRGKVPMARRHNVFVQLAGAGFEGVPLPTKGGKPLPFERATQAGHGTWQFLASSSVENVTEEWLRRLLEVNDKERLRVRLNKELGGSPPILVAAENGKEPLVEFLLRNFPKDLTPPRTEDTNLLNTCIERCSMELALLVWPSRPLDSVCRLQRLQVARVYPDFLRKLPGGTSDETPPAIACSRANKTLSRFLVRSRDPGNDRESHEISRSAMADCTNRRSSH